MVVYHSILILKTQFNIQRNGTNRCKFFSIFLWGGADSLTIRSLGATPPGFISSALLVPLDLRLFPQIEER